MELKDKKITLKDLDNHFKKYRAMGEEPFIKGKGSGCIKNMFEVNAREVK